MQFKHTCLGIRFDFLSYMADGAEAERRAFEALFSALSLRELHGLMLYGGMDVVTEPNHPAYLVVLTGGKLKTMRRIHRKICENTGMLMCLASAQPFVQANTLSRIDVGLVYFGIVDREGNVRDGEAALSLCASNNRGKQRPFGWNIRMVFAPCAFAGNISELEAVKRLTLAARQYFPGVVVNAVPIVEDSAGALRALTIAANGVCRKVSVTAPAGGRAELSYGILRGKTAVLELPACDFAAGEVIRHVLDERLRDIRIAFHAPAEDKGMACARALGVKFYDAFDAECTASEAVERVDTEFLHPAMKEAHFTMLGNLGPSSLGDFLSPLLQPTSGPAVEALLDAADFDTLVTRADLVITGGAQAKAVTDVAARCARAGVPVAIIAQEKLPALPVSAEVMAAVQAVITTGMSPADAGRSFNEAADKMFRYIRAGREMPRRWARRRFLKKARNP